MSIVSTLRIPATTIKGISLALGLNLTLLLHGCPMPYEWRHEGQWNSQDQIWLSEQSQVKLRAAQSRVFDTTDRRRTLEGIVATLQDLGFIIEVVDEDLGLISGKKFVPLEGRNFGTDHSYHLYNDQRLLIFTKAYRSWGPFLHRSDLVRLTVSVRQRNETQLVVRASAQFYLRAIEDPVPYQQFFRALEQALFLEAQRVP